jgi:excisionase family DNA binding protein
MADLITQPRLLKLPDVAALLGVPTETVLSMARSGELPAVRIGKRDPWRVDVRRLEEHFDELKAKSTSWVQPQPPPKTVEARSLTKSAKRSVASTQTRRKQQSVTPIHPTPSSIPAGFMTVGEAAELLGVSWPTVITRIKDGTFQAFKSERRWLVRTADVEAALMKKKVARLLTKRAKRQARLQR